MHAGRRLDHLVYAAPDLDAAIEAIACLVGIRATPGGQHPGWGTRNALVALGPDVFLEIIGPDPDQPALRSPRPFGIDALKEPRLVTWAAKAVDLPRLMSDAASAGIALGPVADGRRRSPAGTLLQWLFTDPRTVVADGIVPFFIDWGSTPHPATTAACGATIIGLHAVHPDAGRVQRMLDILGLDLRVLTGPTAGLVATFDSPHGRVQLA